MPSPGEFAKALRTERAKARQRIWIIGGGAATLLVVIGVLVWLFFFSTVFTARETIVEGVRILTVDDVKAAAAVPMGEPLARVDIAAVSARVADLPEVREVTVERDFPGSVRIAVTERLAVYQLRDGATYQWADEEGVVFRGQQDPVDSMPVVEADGDDQRILRDVATVVQHLPEGLLAEVEGIEADGVDMIEVLLAGNRRVVWGSAEESELKSEVLDALLSVEADIYDVSAPNHPTTR